MTIRAPHNGRVELLSLSGQIVLPGQDVRANTETTVDLGNLTEGTYLLRLSADNRGAGSPPVQVQKVIISK